MSEEETQNTYSEYVIIGEYVNEWGRDTEH